MNDIPKDLTEDMPEGEVGFEVRLDKLVKMYGSDAAIERQQASSTERPGLQEQMRRHNPFMHNLRNVMQARSLAPASVASSGGSDNDDDSKIVKSAIYSLLKDDAAKKQRNMEKEAAHFSDLLIEALHAVSGGARYTQVAVPLSVPRRNRFPKI